MDSEPEDYLLPGEADPRLERRKKRRGALPAHVEACRRRSPSRWNVRRWVLMAVAIHALPVLGLATFGHLDLLGTPTEGGSGWARHYLVVTAGEPGRDPGPGVPEEPQPPLLPAEPEAPVEEGAMALPVLGEPAVLPGASDVRFPVAAEEGIQLPPRPRKGGGSGGPVQGEGESVGSAGEVESPVWNPRPSYPQAARKAGWEGTVEVELEVGEDGRVVRSRVLSTSGHEILDRAALEALTRWRFERRALSIPRVIRQEVVYRLESTKEEP